MPQLLGFLDDFKYQYPRLSDSRRVFRDPYRFGAGADWLAQREQHHTLDAIGNSTDSTSPQSRSSSRPASRPASAPSRPAPVPSRPGSAPSKPASSVSRPATARQAARGNVAKELVMSQTIQALSEGKFLHGHPAAARTILGRLQRATNTHLQMELDTQTLSGGYSSLQQRLDQLKDISCTSASPEEDILQENLVTSLMSPQVQRPASATRTATGAAVLLQQFNHEQNQSCAKTSDFGSAHKDSVGIPVKANMHPPQSGTARKHRPASAMSKSMQPWTPDTTCTSTPQDTSQSGLSPLEDSTDTDFSSLYSDWIGARKENSQSYDKLKVGVR